MREFKGITKDFASVVLETIDTSRDQIAEALKAGHRGIILEADEWRPLADHVAGLMAIAYKAGRKTGMYASITAIEETIDNEDQEG